jgi:hypothetical protein
MVEVRSDGPSGERLAAGLVSDERRAGPMDDRNRIDPQGVRSRAHGKGFLIPLVCAWPLGVFIGLAAVALGAGMGIGIASGLAVALGLNFVWLGIIFAIDDGRVEARTRQRVSGDEPPRSGTR